MKLNKYDRRERFHRALSIKVNEAFALTGLLARRHTGVNSVAQSVIAKWYTHLRRTGHWHNSYKRDRKWEPKHPMRKRWNAALKELKHCEEEEELSRKYKLFSGSYYHKYK